MPRLFHTTIIPRMATGKEPLWIVVFFISLSFSFGFYGAGLTKRKDINAAVGSQGASFTLAFSTYLGGSQTEQIRGVTTDGQGNIYVTGGTASPNFPTTAGAYSRTHNGSYDVFVTKLAPSGRILWSTLLGGPNYDRAYAIEVDAQGFVYLTGRAGPGFPTTRGAFQPIYQGTTVSLYGRQNAFVAKLSPDGSSLVFASYFGTMDGNRDLALDQSGNIFVATGYDPAKFPPLPASWFANSYKKEPSGADCIIAKISNDGSRVIWATYFGGSGIESGTPSIRVDKQGYPVLLSFTNSGDLPTTPGAYNRSFRGVWDMFVAKFTPDGSKLVFSTYLGGSDTEFTETHGLALDAQSNVIVAATTKSKDFPITPTAFQKVYKGSGGSTTGGNTNYPGEGFVAKLSSDGTTLLAATYLGGNLGEGIEGVGVDSQGNVYASGATYSSNFPVTSEAFQVTNGGGADFFVAKLSADLSTLLYGTYLGGNNIDYGRASTVDANGNIYVAGEVKSTNWPTRNALQGSYGGGDSDGAVAKFTPQS
jgi:Beta-propeller repeat